MTQYIHKRFSPNHQITWLSCVLFSFLLKFLRLLRYRIQFRFPVLI